MPTAYFRNTADKRVADGTYTYYFNPTGDVTGAEAEEVRFNFKLDYNNGASVDLDKIQIWLQAPDGSRDRIYYNSPNVFGNDNDDHNDSDDANDFDIDFDGRHSTSRTDDLAGSQVTGTWRLIIENDTGKTLDLDGLEVWVDYKKPEDYRISNIEILGTQQVGQPVTIRTTIENIGELYKIENVSIEYLVNGEVIGTSALPLGLLPGASNIETELHTFDLVGANQVTARIVGSPDTITSNNSLTRTFIFDHNNPDLEVTDVRVSGNGEAGSTYYITADVTNVGNATHFGDILLEYVVNGEVIGTQTIGGAGVNVMLPGTENTEIEAHFMSDVGENDIEVRIANPSGSDHSSANDSYSTTLTLTAPAEAPDLEITDLRVIGGWEVGETVNLRAHIENNGDEAWNILAGLPYVEYFVRYEGDSAWQTVGGDALTGGTIAGFSEWVSTDFTLEEDGPFEVRVDVRGRDYEPDTDNNTWRETAGYSRADVPQKTLANSASDVELATFMARSVYGMVDVQEEYRNDDYVNGIGDRYISYLDTIGFRVLTDQDFGDLFRPVDELALFNTYMEDGELEGGMFVGDTGLTFTAFDTWQAQGLVAEGLDAEGKKTLTITFRGTDGVDFLESLVGQAWTGNGLFDYYESMRPMIEAALAYANDSANGIEKVLVSGHSLGGAAADAFSLVDAHRLDDSIDLTVVSIASPGVSPAFLTDTLGANGMLGQYDATGLFDGASLVAQPFYIGLSHQIDAVTYAALNPLNPLFNVPNQLLTGNVNMDNNLIPILTPNIENGDLPGYNFGAGHNSGLYWANLSQLTNDPLVASFAGHRVIVGLSDYSAITDLDGTEFGVFVGYEHYNETSGNPDDDAGAQALNGNQDADYILGFSGHDELFGFGGEDLLSGGSGNDLLSGGTENDIIDGGTGSDTIFGGTGDDSIDGGSGSDSIYGNDGADTILGGSGDDLIFGNAQDDSIEGNSGYDTIIGGTGNDTIYGNGEDDLIRGGGEADRLLGGLGNDTLDGGFGWDALIGNDGNDYLQGRVGDDRLDGGSGRDTLEGDAGNDILYGNGGNDILRGGGDVDRLYGGFGDDSLDGSYGWDVLIGNEGADTLNGGIGNDRLTGGADADVFQFAFGDGSDMVTDYVDGTDQIEILSGATSFADLTITENGGDALVTFGNVAIQLNGVADTALDAMDFIF